MYAWEQKLKGATIYRDGCLRSGILLTNTSSEEAQDEKLERGYIEDVPADLQYRKYKLATGCGFLYLFIGVDKDTGKIYDCFTNTDGTGGCVVNTQANSRLLSTAIRGGISIEHLIKQLEKSGVCPSFQYKRGKGEELCKGKSCASAIAHVLREIVKEMPNKDTKKAVGKIVCPECKSENYVMQEGCTSCMDCGYSKCSV
jgi:ribonucleoside-diphosphate reductase alpha chain